MLLSVRPGNNWEKRLFVLCNCVQPKYEPIWERSCHRTKAINIYPQIIMQSSHVNADSVNPEMLPTDNNWPHIVHLAYSISRETCRRASKLNIITSNNIHYIRLERLNCYSSSRYMWIKKKTPAYDKSIREQIPVLQRADFGFKSLISILHLMPILHNNIIIIIIVTMVGNIVHYCSRIGVIIT